VFFGCADSLEDQEGGAMYISCDVSNGGPVEPETGYVPNNPLFGLALDSPQVSPGILNHLGFNLSVKLFAFGRACISLGKSITKIATFSLKINLKL